MQSVEENMFEIEKVNMVDTNQHTKTTWKIRNTLIKNQNTLKIDVTRAWKSKGLIN